MCQLHRLGSHIPGPVRGEQSPAAGPMAMQTDVDPELFMSDLSKDKFSASDKVVDPNATPQDVSFTWNPQDRRVMEAGTTVIKGVVQGPRGPETDRVRLNDQLEPLDGKYVFPEGDPRAAKAATFAGVARALDMFRKAYGDFPFAFGNEKLGVFADAGKMLQGFYKREQKGLIFYHSPDPIFGNTVYSGASNDVASHETGHAILDGIRPNYYASPNPEPRAFHEAFGDMMAIHSALCDERVVARVAVQTGGDLSKANVAAQIAEEMGTAVNNEDGANTTGGDFLRDANNSFKFADPSTLKEKSSLQELSWNRHNFSRVWTGTHFDLLKLMVKDEMQHGKNARQAITDANAELLQMLANMIKEAPVADFTYKDMALAFLKSDAKYHDGKRLDLIKQAFVGRNILPAETPLPEIPSVKTQTLFQSSDWVNVIENGPHSVLPKVSTRTLSLPLDESFGQFCGARLELPVDQDLSDQQLDATRTRTYQSLRNLNEAGRIRYNEPNKPMNFPDDYVNPKGEPYTAALFWEGDQMIIRALPFTVCS